VRNYVLRIAHHRYLHGLQRMRFGRTANLHGVLAAALCAKDAEIETEVRLDRTYNLLAGGLEAFSGFFDAAKRLDAALAKPDDFFFDVRNPSLAANYVSADKMAELASDDATFHDIHVEQACLIGWFHEFTPSDRLAGAYTGVVFCRPDGWPVCFAGDVGDEDPARPGNYAVKIRHEAIPSLKGAFYSATTGAQVELKRPRFIPLQRRLRRPNRRRRAAGRALSSCAPSSVYSHSLFNAAFTLPPFSIAKSPPPRPQVSTLRASCVRVIARG